MRSRMVLPLLVLAATSAVITGTVAAEKEAFTVYVSARRGAQPPPPEEAKALKKELEAKVSEAHEAFKALEKEFKRQYGKKPAAWPAEKQAQHDETWNGYGEALYALNYLDLKQQEIEDSVQDVKDAIAGKGLPRAKRWVRQVDGPEEADLLVEVLGRRSEGMLGASVKYLCIRLSPGPRLDPKALSGVGPRGRPPFEVVVLHRYTADGPFWKLEVEARTMLWGLAAEGAARVIDEFVKENYDGLMSSRTNVTL